MGGVYSSGAFSIKEYRTLIGNYSALRKVCPKGVYELERTIKKMVR
jgi:hypothetical protein